MRLKKNIATSETGFLFNPGTGDSYSSNVIGSEILASLKEGNTRQSIVESICDRYDVEKTQAERDLDDFMSLLRDFNLLDK
jgi:hypothetical protein